MENTILTFMYSMVGVVGCIGFMPQIYKLIKATEHSDNMALSTWMVWSVTGAITVAYAFSVVQDSLFTAVAAINCLCTMMILSLGFYNKYFRFGQVRVLQK